MSLTTKDKEQAINFKRALGIKVKIGRKASGSLKEKKYFHVQFGDVKFYKFLLAIGFTQAKSKTLGAIKVPNRYFFDFLRGNFDGDGSFYSYWDPRWRSSHMFYFEFVSASARYIEWLREKIKKRLNINGHVTNIGGNRDTQQLKYAKKEALEVIRKIYYNREVVCLSRKRKKIERALKIEGEQQKLYARVEKR